MSLLPEGKKDTKDNYVLYHLFIHYYLYHIFKIIYRVFFIVRKGDKTLTRQYDRAVFQGSEFCVERNIDTPFCDVVPSFAAHVCWQCYERFLKSQKRKKILKRNRLVVIFCKRFSKLQGKQMMRFLLYQNFLENKNKNQFDDCLTLQQLHLDWHLDRDLYVKGT